MYATQMTKAGYNVRNAEDSDLVKTFKVKSDHWRKCWDEHLFTGTGVHFLSLLIWNIHKNNSLIYTFTSISDQS